MKIKYRDHRPHWELPNEKYFVTYSAAKGRILNEEARNIIMSAYKFWDEKQYTLWALVVMPDHVHSIIQPVANQTLGGIHLKIRSFTAHEINKLERINGSLWPNEPYDRLLRNDDEVLQKTIYIKENPEKAGIVKSWRDYKWIYFRPE